MPIERAHRTDRLDVISAVPPPTNIAARLSAQRQGTWPQVPSAYHTGWTVVEVGDECHSTQWVRIGTLPYRYISCTSKVVIRFPSGLAQPRHAL